MTYADIIAFYGSQATAARKLGISPQELNHWRIRGLPRYAAYYVQVRSRGRLRASEKGANAAAPLSLEELLRQ